MTRPLYIAAIITVAIFIGACSVSDRQEEKARAIDTHYIEQQPIKVAQSNSFDSLACIVLRHIDDSLDAIRMDAGRIISSHDSCVLEVIDAVTDKFILTHDKKYMIAIDSLAQKSDGYVSEHFYTISVNLYKKALPFFAEYLFYANTNNKMMRFLKRGLLYEARNRVDSMKRYERLVLVAQRAELTPEQKAITNSILTDVKQRLDQGEDY